MTWTTTPVQQAVKVFDNTSNAISTTVDASLASDPTVGNLLVAAISTSSSVNTVNDGWIKDPSAQLNEFTGLYVYYRRVAAGDDTTALKTFTRTLPAADRTVVALTEWTGAGPFDALHILDKIANSDPGGTQSSISSGTTATLDQPDGLALAFYSIPRILGSGNDTLGPYTNSFTEVLEAGTVGGDAPALSVAVKDVGNSIAAVETTATIDTHDLGNPVEHRPLGMVLVFKTDPPVTIVPRLSGGASNADPNLSIGGTRSSVVAPLGTLHDVSRLQADAVGGHTDYKLVYLHNIANLRSLSAGVKVYVPQQPTVGTIDIGIATEASGVTVTAVANETTAPAGVSFSSPSVLGSALDAGTIGPDAARGLWIRRTIPRFSSASASNPGIIRFNATPL